MITRSQSKNKKEKIIPKIRKSQNLPIIIQVQFSQLNLAMRELTQKGYKVSVLGRIFDQALVSCKGTRRTLQELNLEKFSWLINLSVDSSPHIPS